jgi:Flp pilus assembly pilin Flp
MQKLRISLLLPLTRLVLRRKRSDCRGQTLVEYGLILVVISIVSVVVLRNLGTTVLSLYSFSNNNLSAVNSVGS